MSPRRILLTGGLLLGIAAGIATLKFSKSSQTIPPEIHAEPSPPPASHAEATAPPQPAADRERPAARPRARDLTALLEAGDQTLKPGELLMYADTLALSDVDRFLKAIEKSGLGADLRNSLAVAALRSASRTADIRDILAYVKTSLPPGIRPGAVIQASFNQSGSPVSICLAAIQTLDESYREAAVSGLSFKISATKTLAEIDLAPRDFRGPRGIDLANALSIRLTHESLATQSATFHQSLDLIGHDTREAAVFMASSSRVIPFEAWGELVQTVARGTDAKGERLMIANMIKADADRGMSTLMENPSPSSETQIQRVRDAVQVWAEADAGAVETWWQDQQSKFDPQTQDAIIADFAIDALRKKQKDVFEKWYSQIRSNDIREQLEQYR